MKTMNNVNFYGEHFCYMEKVRKTAIAFSAMVVEKQTDRIMSRIKQPESMTNKILSDGYPVNYDSMFIKESDAIGLRIVTDSLSNVYSILDNIKLKSEESNGFRVIKIKDFIKTPKSSGYRSVHIIMGIKSDDPEYPEFKVEIQIRTAIMDCWASLEHIMKYKQVIEVTPELHDMLETYSAEAEREIANLN